MRKKILIAFILIFFTITFFNFGYKYEKTIKKSFDAGKDFTFKLKNCNGSIEVVTTKGNTIDIKAVKYSNNEDSFNKTKLKFKEGDGYLKVSIDRPSRNCKTSYRFYIKLPQHLSMADIGTVNGSLDIDGIMKDLEADTVNGKISFEGTFEDAEFSTVNGSVGIYQKKVLTGDLNIKTVNGSIKIEIDKNSSFNLRAGTINGSIKSDFNLKKTKRFIGSKMDGSVNKGEFDVVLKTVNGSIKILGS